MKQNRFENLHEWGVTPAEAKAIQMRLRAQVVRRDDVGEVKLVAGVDAGFFAEGKMTRGAVAVLSFPELAVVETAVIEQATTFPYVPGLLSFREVPPLLAALSQLSRLPDLILCDGQGVAHPRRFGLACHLGIITDIPTIGVAKTRFVGTHEAVGEEKGAFVPLWHEGEQVGVVLRSRTAVRPLFVSAGHRVGLETAVFYVLACTPKYRLPETTRRADYLASGY